MPTHATVAQYLASLPPERRAAIDAVRAVVLENLDEDYEEGMQYGMLAWYVPHRVFPAGYHCDPTQPLMFAAISSRKAYLSLFLMSVYGGGEHQEWFRKAWAKTGKKLDMGAACIRFKKVEDLALDVIAEAVRRVPAKKFVERYVKMLGERTAKRPKPPAKKKRTGKAGK